MTIYMKSLLTNEAIKASVTKPPKIENVDGKFWKKIRIRLDNVPITLFYESVNGKSLFFYLDLKWYKLDMYEYEQKFDLMLNAKDNHFTEIILQTYNQLPQTQKEMIKKHNAKIRATKKKNEEALKKAGKFIR